jgi:hypothetical protein
MDKNSMVTTPQRLLVAVTLMGAVLCGLPRTALAADGASSSIDEQKNPHLWQPRTTSVAVFKNGLGFFLRQGSVELRDGWAVAKEIPPAKFGTLAVYATRDDDLVDVIGSGPGEVTEFDGVDAPRDMTEKRGRLEAAKNLSVELSYKHQGTDKTAAGKLVSIGPDYAVLENSGNSFAVPVEGVFKMQVLELPLRVHVNQGEGAAKKTEIGMAYLREGITWIPEYSLRILDDETAELTLRGTLVNEAEDLIHCDVNFVVGVPHFVHTQYLAPIAVGQVIRAIGAAVAPPEIRSQIMNHAAIGNGIRSNQFDQPGGPAVVQQPVTTGSADALASAVGNLPKLDSTGATDYTVYTKTDLTVRCGERAIVTLFVKKIRYGHIYRWTPPAAMEHNLVLHNDTDTAWTTGPVLAVSGDTPLSEDLLKYTPKNGRAEVPVTTAINVAHDKTESEADRKFKAHSPSHNVFLDLVTLDGELRLQNFEKSPVDIVVVNRVPGKPLDVSDHGVPTSDPAKLQLLERQGTIRWTIRLGPGETKKITYAYERYVPSS